MALNLNGSTQYLYSGSWNPHSQAYPFTFAGWFYTTDMAQNSALMCLDNNTGGSYINLAQFFGSGTSPNDPVRALTYQTSWASAATTTGATTGTWHHFAAVWAATNDRRVYIDGSSKGTDSTTKTFGAQTTQLGIGARYANAAGAAADLLFGGKLAHCAAWTSALSDANVASLAGGSYPTAVDSGNLEDYWDLISDSNSDGGNTGTSLTEVGSPTYDADDPLSSTVTVELAASGDIVFSGTADLGVSPAVVLEASGVITFVGAADLTKQTVVKGLTSDGTRMIIGLGNDELWYEGV